jgi:nucleoside-triphosphatase THEP1
MHLQRELKMSESLIAALVYADGVYPDRVIARAISPLRERGVAMAGAIQLEPIDLPGRHPCDLLLEDLASGEVTAIAEHRGKEARGCRLDVGVLTEIAETVAASLHTDTPRLLIVNKFGKIEADGGGLRDAIAEAVELGIPVLVGVPARNLDRWRAFAGQLAIELEPRVEAISGWLQAHGLTTAAQARAAAGAGLTPPASR